MIVTIDQGTTGTTVLIFNAKGGTVGKAYREFSQIFPRPGWVEHDAEEIWEISCDALLEAFAQAKISASDVEAIGIANQRETIVLWDRETGKPVHNAIVWQCRRSSELCDAIRKDGHAEWILEKTGLVLDAYFSASKLQWLFQEYPELLGRAKAGELCAGTIDSWLIWNLSSGKEHLTDHTNASRTMLYNIETKDWDDDLLEFFGIPGSVLPEIKPSSGLFGHTNKTGILGARLPIMGVAGDQQAALFGQGCIKKGDIKNTYGTGCFMLMYVGETRPSAGQGLLTTIACDRGGKPVYALEGGVFIAGAAVQWLRDQLGLISEASETEAIANSIDDTQGVYIVPAFTGMGAPYWNADARGGVVGLTRGSGRAEIVRAVLESIVYQSCDLANAMCSGANIRINTMRVDGGASVNNFIMQFQADMLGKEIQRPNIVESTALGAALLAGIACEFWNLDNLPESMTRLGQKFSPQIAKARRERLYQGWHSAVEAIL